QAERLLASMLEGDVSTPAGRLGAADALATGRHSAQTFMVSGRLPASGIGMAQGRSFFSELKRRNVLRTGVLYIGVAWALSQGAAQLLPVFDVPNWAVRWLIITAALGFPFWLAFNWFYKLTPEGLQRESEDDTGEPFDARAGKRLDRWIIATLAI